MKKLRVLLFVLLGVLAFSSCSSDKTMIAKGVDLKKYEYASLTQAKNGFGTTTDIEIEPGIYDAVESTRLQMVGERRIEELSSEEKAKLVLVKYSATSTTKQSVLSVSFEDFMTGKTVASCRASNGSAWTRQRDVDRAIRKIAGRIRSVWK